MQLVKLSRNQEIHRVRSNVVKTLVTEHGYNEANLRDLFTPALGQKFYQLWRLNLAYPDLEIWVRISDDLVLFNSIDGSTLRKITDRSQISF